MEAEDIRELFAAFGPVQVRAMFGGQGVYADGLMFALQAGGVLYLKADPLFAQALAARGAAPFSYDTDKGRRTITSYWQVPEAAIDDPEDLADLARQALSIARAAAAARPKKARAPKLGASGGVAAARRAALAPVAGKPAGRTPRRGPPRA